jgi:hypothetical protein
VKHSQNSPQCVAVVLPFVLSAQSVRGLTPPAVLSSFPSLSGTFATRADFQDHF